MQIPNKKYSLGYEFKYIKNNCKEIIIIKITIVEIKDTCISKCRCLLRYVSFLNVQNISISVIKWFSFAVTRGSIQPMQKIMLQ